jgi:hypothetical protein
MLTDIVTKSFHNLKLQRDMNILQENDSSIDSYLEIVKTFCNNICKHMVFLQYGSAHDALQFENVKTFLSQYLQGYGFSPVWVRS